MGGALQLCGVEGLAPAVVAGDEGGVGAEALVALEDVVLDVRAVVGGRVPAERDGVLGAVDHLGREGLVGLAALGQEGDRVAGAAWRNLWKENIL